MSDFYNYRAWAYTKIVDTIYEYHLMDQIYDIYDTNDPLGNDPTDKIVRGCLGSEIKVYRVWRTSNGEWVFKETEYE